MIGSGCDIVVVMVVVVMVVGHCGVVVVVVAVTTVVRVIESDSYNISIVYSWRAVGVIVVVVVLFELYWL